jgi:spore germination protein GerM
MFSTHYRWFLSLIVTSIVLLAACVPTQQETATPPPAGPATPPPSQHTAPPAANPPPAPRPLVGSEWQVAYDGDLNRDGVRDVVAYKPANIELAPSMQQYVTLDTVLAAEVVVVQANQEEHPVVQFAAERDGLKRNGENINPFRTDMPSATPAAFIVEVMPDSNIKLNVLPVNGAGEGFTQAVPVIWNAAEQRYNLTGPGQVSLETHTPDEIEIVLYWAVGAELQPEHRRIPHTRAVGKAALELLLEGPQQTGLSTALPTHEEVQTYPGRQPDWGDRVRVLGLTIEDGVATANFSQEMQAYGGGSARVAMIREQITRTLKQFPTVDEVRIAVEGETEGVLQP